MMNDLAAKETRENEAHEAELVLKVLEQKLQSAKDLREAKVQLMRDAERVLKEETLRARYLSLDIEHYERCIKYAKLDLARLAKGY